MSPNPTWEVQEDVLVEGVISENLNQIMSLSYSELIASFPLTWNKSKLFVLIFKVPVA